MEPKIRDLRPAARRNFLKWAGAVGAAYGLHRSRVVDWVLDSGGTAYAEELQCEGKVNRSVHLVAGDGSLCWFTLLWPPVGVGQNFQAGFSYHAPGQGSLFTGDGGKKLWMAPEAPWQSGGVPTGQKGVTVMMAGDLAAMHTPQPMSAVSFGDGSSLMAVAASIQRATPALLPVIGVDPISLGTAPGAPSIATVPNAAGMIALFDSAASRLTLQATEDKELYETYYKAMLGLRSLSGRPTAKRQLEVTKTAANVLGRNLAAQLAPSQADLDLYGVPTLLASQASARAKEAYENLARSLITGAKAFALGLTNSLVIQLAPGGNDAQYADPHGITGQTQLIQDTVTALGTILNAFFQQLSTMQDPSCIDKKLDETTVLTVHGDTPHDPLRFDGWPDGTVGGSNWMYVMSNGYLKPGWFGDYRTDGTVKGFDPSTGGENDSPSIATSASASAAAAYAIAKGDMETVKRFYNGPPIDGLVLKPA